MKGEFTYQGTNIVIDLKNKEDYIDRETNNLLVEDVYDIFNGEIIQCDEINGNLHHGEIWINNELSIFLFSNNNYQELKQKGKTTLFRQGNMADFIDTSKKEHLDFLKWYFSEDDVQQVVQKMYNECGWVVTDIDSFQAYKDLMPNHVKND